MKKASLNLSINAIVILILAITMLGLGLTFMKTMFGKVTDQFGEVSSEIETEIIKKLESSSSRLEFTNTQIEMKRGEEKTVYFGVYNNLQADCNFGDSSKLYLKDYITNFIYCDEGLTSGNAINSATYELIPDSTTIARFTTLSLDTFKGKQIEKNKGKVFPLKIAIDSNAAPDTYSCHITIPLALVLKSSGGGGLCAGASSETFYAKKDFFIIVK